MFSARQYSKIFEKLQNFLFLNFGQRHGVRIFSSTNQKGFDGWREIHRNLFFSFVYWSLGEQSCWVALALVYWCLVTQHANAISIYDARACIKQRACITHSLTAPPQAAANLSVHDVCLCDVFQLAQKQAFKTLQNQMIALPGSGDAASVI